MKDVRKSHVSNIGIFGSDEYVMRTSAPMISQVEVGEGTLRISAVAFRYCVSVGLRSIHARYVCEFGEQLKDLVRFAEDS